MSDFQWYKLASVENICNARRTIRRNERTGSEVLNACMKCCCILAYNATTSLPHFCFSLSTHLPMIAVNECFLTSIVPVVFANPKIFSHTSCLKSDKRNLRSKVWLQLCSSSTACFNPFSQKALWSGAKGGRNQMGMAKY